MSKWYFVHPDKINGRSKDWDFYENAPAWTTNPISANKYVEEYGLVGIDMLIKEVDCDTFQDFVEYIKDTYNEDISAYNEINVYYSDERPEIYHAKTYMIDDDYASGGLLDAQSRYIEQAICRSMINMLNLSNYMKIPNMKDDLLKLLRDYVQLFVLLENTSMTEYNEYDKKIMQAVGCDDINVEDGIFAILDMVTYERLCAGVPV